VERSWARRETLFLLDFPVEKYVEISIYALQDVASVTMSESR
jgi:hypothetical protein